MEDLLLIHTYQQTSVPFGQLLPTAARLLTVESLRLLLLPLVRHKLLHLVSLEEIFLHLPLLLLTTSEQWRLRLLEHLFLQLDDQFLPHLLRLQLQLAVI